MLNKKEKIVVDPAIFKLRTAVHLDTRSDEDRELIEKAICMLGEVRDGKC